MPPTQHTESAISADRYRIEQALGEGGMGAVYRALDLRRDERVALKRLRVSPGERGYSRRLALFRREYRTLAQLSHPRIIRVFDYGVDAEGPYYTMELLEGEDVRSRVPMVWRQVVVVLRDVASCLAILHSRRLLHRDITPRNVHLGADGRAKLIDFGTMTHMGNTPWLAGTAPYVPPEAVAVQSLDARADLFAVGALGYYLLTGDNAYPAKRLSGLRDAWQDPPPAPSTVSPSVPQALSQLVMQLLSLDRAARPGSAAEVIERLHVLAPDLAEEGDVVPQAYLATPSLVGRDGPLRRVHNRIVTAKAGSAASLLIQGPPGVGRSRFLDVAALEARLSGAYLARADAGAARAGELGVARALVAQLLEQLPLELANDCPSVLTEAVEGGTSVAPPRDGETVSKQSRLYATMRRWLLSISEEHFVALAVDDIHAIDAASAALLAALSWDAYEQRLLLLLSYDSSARPPANMAALRNAASLVELAPLSEPQTEVLARSLFGDVPGVAGLARQLFEISQGIPRAVMTAAEQLVANREVRYNAGRWVLPERIDASRLPTGYSTALALRLRALPTPAVELARAMALRPDVSFRAEDCTALCPGGDAEGALDDLLAAQVVIDDRHGYGLAHAGWVPALRRELGPEDQRRLHGRLAVVFQRRDEAPYRLAHHLLLSGEERLALDALTTALANAKTGHVLMRGRGDPADTLLLAIDACERLGRPARDRFLLQRDLTAAAAFSDVPGACGHALEMLEVLERDSGLTLFAEIGQELDPAERVGRVLAEAQRRHGARPAAERVLPPFEALESLATHALATLSLAAANQDHALIARVPTLAPFMPLARSVEMVERIAGSVRDLDAGRTLRARRQALAALALLKGLEGKEIDPLLAQYTRVGLVYAVGHMEAGLGIPSATRWCDELDNDEMNRVSAWRLRMVYQLARGDNEAAERCRERAERLLLTAPPRKMFQSSELDVLLRTHIFSDDLVGIRRVADRIATLAVDAPGWQLWVRLAEGHVALLRQDNECAFALLHTLVDDTRPGVHEVWSLAVEGRLRALLQLGWSGQVRDDAEAALAQGEAAELDVLLGGTRRALALAEAALGNHGDAVALVESVIDELVELGASGVLLGRAYEDRARVAIAMGDAAAFGEHATRAAAHYNEGRNPFLTARFQALLEDARRAGVPLPRTITEPRMPGAPPRNEALASNVRSRIANGPDAEQRASSALDLIRKVALADEAHLYVLAGPHLRLAACHPRRPSPLLVDALQEFLRQELSDDVVTVTADPVDVNQVTGDGVETVEAEGRRYQPCLVMTPRLEGRVPVAIVALGGATARDRSPPRELLEAIAMGLVEAGDVTIAPRS